MSGYKQKLLGVTIYMLTCSGLGAQSPEPTIITTIQPTSSLSPTEYQSTAPTGIPTLRPQAIKSKTPTRAPQQQRPTAHPTRASTLPLEGPIVKTVQIKLNGIDTLSSEDQIFFENQTKAYIESYYLGTGKDLLILFQNKIKVTRTNKYTSKTTSQGRRRLPNDNPSLVITYNQTLLYRPFSSTTTINETVVKPFENVLLRNNYKWYLQQAGRSVFTNVTAVDYPTICDSECSKTSDNKTSDNVLIISASVGGGSALIIVLVISLICCKRKKALQQEGRSRPLLTRHKDETDASYSLDPPVHSVVTNGEESVVSVDYDYSRPFYIEGNEQSVSSAGGTLGSATRRSKISGIDSKGVSGGGTTLSTDEASFEARFRKQIVREETLIVIAPAGKLGVVIDSPEVGGPIVHAIKEGSVLEKKLRVGDRLVAVDEEDVRTMSAIQVSKLISRKGLNAERKLTVLRSIQTTR